jgi:chromosomal replication initiation ATPase DnaA
MIKTIEIAKCTLSDIFNIRREELNIRTRTQDVIEAKRYLIYFLVNELGMKFVEVPKYIKSIRSHATAMHHYYKMKDLLEMKHETKTQTQYIQFKNQVIEKGMDKLERELSKQIELKKVVSWNIKQLKGLIDEA